MQVSRCEYIIKTNLPKQNGEKLTSEDLINVGYMAGRYGVNLDGNIQANYPPRKTEQGTIINVNSCTTDLLEQNLSKEGINFDKII